MTSERPLILLTNDDGILSPGLLAAARALEVLGEVIAAAPREQQTSTGRSLPVSSDGQIQKVSLANNGAAWSGAAYSVGGTPAQAVLHAVLEILPRRPDLVVSGINYGENIGSGITISGTVGAAIEAAAMGIPALAVSLQILSEDWYSYHDLDFSVAAAFTIQFAQSILEKHLPPDVDLLKLDIPAEATAATPWRVTSQSRQRYYVPYLIREGSWDTRGYVGAQIKVNEEDVERDSDVYALMFDHVVSVTPVSIDMTSRVDLKELQARL